MHSVIKIYLFVYVCVQRLTELVRRKWPVQSRDADHVTSAYAASWKSINVTSFDVFSSVGHQLEKMVLRCVVNIYPMQYVANYTKRLVTAVFSARTCDDRRRWIFIDCNIDVIIAACNDAISTSWTEHSSCEIFHAK
jgi:hypothetical protein